ncbi:hypothetical protein JZ751_018299 [Albula glossodonta]|uniref:GBD/FH3 domain-containing protein n=1 Tax=Albula glossodonta TaxID=121402 RepID=A0A8T2NWM6_9TELE|nr:hypothetical protein JZ751_018299 [Albula glossodonta]
MTEFYCVYGFLQDDKDLVPEFVNSEGLTCFIKVGAEADHNYQNYILRGTIYCRAAGHLSSHTLLREMIGNRMSQCWMSVVITEIGDIYGDNSSRGQVPKTGDSLSQIMLFVDGMNGVINHNETVQWLYTLSGSLSRLVVKTALKLLIVFVEYTESNGPLLIQGVNTVDGKRGVKPWSYLTEILEERNGSDSELLVYTMTLINKTLAALPDQDSFYDVTDCLEQQGMERIMQKHMNSKGTEPDLKQQFTIYENALKYEDGEVEEASPHIRKERRKVASNTEEGRKSRRSSGQSLPDVSLSTTPPSSQSPTTGLSRTTSPQPSEPHTPEPATPSSADSESQRSSPILSPVSSNGSAPFLSDQDRRSPSNT